MAGSDLLCTAWRKSSRSGGSNDCVEVAALWRKSSRSGPTNDWIEAASLRPAGTAIRDSKNPAGPALRFPSRAWDAFLTGVSRSDFTAH